MRILVCDDDPLITKQLHKYITEYFSHKKLHIPDICVFSDGESLIQDTGEKDIVFLDVEMPGISGIHTGRTLQAQNPNIIIFIVTSYIEYLDEAMRFHVFRYLTKPIDKMRLFHNLKDALRIYNSYEEKLLIEEKESNHIISSFDIIFIETDRHRTIIHTIQKDYYSIQPMQYWINTLNQHYFFQSNRSFIVNLQHVTDFDHFQIHLYNGKFTANLTSRKYSSFKNAYLLYLESMR